jgi:Sulfotransferase family
MMSLRPDDLIAAAVSQTGHDDFGGDSFREGLAIYCESVSHEAGLNAFGEMAVPASIVGALANRLRVVAWATGHPEVAAEQIEAPWIVVGIFRAGTTFLSYLLEKDERSRPLLGWEAGNSVPPSLGDHRRDPRGEAMRAASAGLDAMNPRIKIVNNEEPDGPTECISVLNQDFKSLTWEAITNVPSYGQWLRGVDHHSAYEYHRLVLQVLQSGGVRGRWSLKSPHHAMRLDALTSVYPDARIIVLHRDPTVLCASVCSLISTLTQTFSDVDHTAYIARHWSQMLEDSITGIDDFRRRRPDVHIHDVHYADLVTDPLGTVGRVYAAFGDVLDGPALAAMTAHVESHPKGRFGRHAYDLTEFGLDPGAVAERFAGYVSRYAIPLERAQT